MRQRHESGLVGSFGQNWLRRRPSSEVGSPPPDSGRGVVHSGRRGRVSLAEGSFLRQVDARAKLCVALLLSCAAMLPLRPLAVACAACLGLQIAAGLLRHTLSQLRRVLLWLAMLFVADWLLVDATHALTVSLRLLLWVTAFVIVLATTSADELRRAIESVGLPRRFAFAFATAYRSLDWLTAEWRGVLEAQAARGVSITPGLRGRPWTWPAQMVHLVPLVVPAVVLGTQRAWALAEAAALRGIDTPGLPRPSGQRLGGTEWLLVGAATAGLLVLSRWS